MCHSPCTWCLLLGHKLNRAQRQLDNSGDSHEIWMQLPAHYRLLKCRWPLWLYGCVNRRDVPAILQCSRGSTTNISGTPARLRRCNNSLCLTTWFITISIVFEVSILQTTQVPLYTQEIRGLDPGGSGKAEPHWGSERRPNFIMSEHHSQQRTEKLGFLLRSSSLSPLLKLMFFTEGHYQNFSIHTEHC